MKFSSTKETTNVIITEMQKRNLEVENRRNTRSNLEVSLTDTYSRPIRVIPVLLRQLRTIIKKQIWSDVICECILFYDIYANSNQKRFYWHSN